MEPQRPKKLVFRIRKRYFEAIKQGEKTVEYRKNSPFWQKRVFGMTKEEYAEVTGVADESPFKWIVEKYFIHPLVAVFVCGRRVHRREILAVERLKTPDWFSQQGQKDVDTPMCLAFHLGEEVSANRSCH